MEICLTAQTQDISIHSAQKVDLIEHAPALISRHMCIIQTKFNYFYLSKPYLMTEFCFVLP